MNGAMTKSKSKLSKTSTNEVGSKIFGNSFKFNMNEYILRKIEIPY